MASSMTESVKGIHTGVHEQMSTTYGGRNEPARVAHGSRPELWLYALPSAWYAGGGFPSKSCSTYPRVVSSPGWSFFSFVRAENIVVVVGSRWRSIEGPARAASKNQPPSERRYATRMFSPGLCTTMTTNRSVKLSTENRAAHADGSAEL